MSKESIAEYKKNLKIAGPVALSQLGHMAVGVADSIMTGSLGGTYLAAVTVAFSIHIPFLMIGIGISYGVSPLIAKADGENNPSEISGILKHSIFLNLVVGLLLFILLFFSADLLHLLKQPREVVVLAIPFFRILAVSMIPIMIFQTFRQFSEGLAITRQAMMISIAGNVINIALNYLLIYGKYGFPKLGVNGAGYATLTARIFMAIAMFGFAYSFKNFSQYWSRWKSIEYSGKMYFKLIKMSLPVGLQLSLESGAFGFAAIMVGWLGASQIAAHHVALNMAAITYMAATGIASAATVRVGHEFGKKDYEAVRMAGISALKIVIVFMSITALSFVVFRHSLPALYIKETDITEMAVALLLISAFFQLSDGVQVVGLGALRGLGDVRVPTAIALVAYWFIGLPVGYIFAFPMRLGVEGVWYGLFAGLTVAALMLSIRFHIKSKKLLRAR